MLGLMAISIARRMGKPVAVEAVGCAWSAMWDHGSAAGKAFAPIHWRQMRKAVGRADNVIYVTENFLQDRYPTRAQNISNASNVELPPSDIIEGQPTLDRATLTKRLKRIECAVQGELRLGLVGSLRVRSKGIQFVLPALKSLKRCDRPFSFHVLGAGDARPWIEEAKRHGVADLVTFHGSLPEGQAVFDWLDHIDIYLQPSLQEGLPRALIEAMSRGCPAIGSNCAGIPELLDERMVVPMRDVDALLQRILALMADSDEMARQAMRNFKTAHAYLSPTLAERREAFFRKVQAQSLGQL
ncbi:glycosyltransferase [Aurantiacibacter aquimixticola]|uniref:Glycosyltransferase n=1 Tax=Aurantiacibacter aquimixticola TaxID=1958945 RepID=A0A419RSI3_9SPHN|nr:glycosyltransferase [Aurantiacibacter aquimixticola]